MLHLNDYKHKAVIFVMSSNNKIRFANENFVLEDKKTGKILNQMPCSKIFAVFIIGSMTITSKIIEKSSYYGFSLILMKQNFKPYGFMGALTEGNTLLRKKQYIRMPNYEMSKYIVFNKVQNQLKLLKEIRKKNADEKKAICRLKEILQSIQNEKNTANDLLLGKEGNASKIFFKNYFKDIGWQARRPRVKNDPINTLLDIGYTFLFNFIEAHLRLYGFDVYVGFYHRLFYQRKSLVCDLEEPFRCIIDKTIRKGFHLQQFKNEDFKIIKGRYVLKRKKNKEYTRIIFEDLLEYKEDIFKYIRDFYRAFMKEKKIEEYPIFNIIE